MRQSCHTISKFALLLTISSCASDLSNDTMNDIMHGTIAYPFVDEKPLGINRRKEKLVIRSIVDQSEYVIEIPGAGEDYDIEIPLAPLAKSQKSRAKNAPSPATTDRELIDNFPDATAHKASEMSLVDKAFGVGPTGGPTQAPSYTLGLANITDLYKKRKFEHALIEVNHLLGYYPTSPRLHKMKGTVYMRLANFTMAQRAWQKALELTPSDRQLQVSLERLRQQLALSKPESVSPTKKATADLAPAAQKN